MMSVCLSVCFLPPPLSLGMSKVRDNLNDKKIDCLAQLYNILNHERFENALYWFKTNGGFAGEGN